MPREKAYTAEDIQDLGDRDYVRLRTQIYFGSMHPTTYQVPLLSEDQLKLREVEFIPAVYKAINEVIDNCLDEFAQIDSRIKLLKIDADPKTGTYTVSDNGRGIPIEKKKDREDNLTWVPELVLGRLRSGRNFKTEKDIGVIGQNGVGAACTNFCSTDFSVDVYRDGKHYAQQFNDGGLDIKRPKVSEVNGSKTGTSVSFTLDKGVFKTVKLPELLIKNRMHEIALTNPDITVEYNGERIRYKKGFEEYVERLASGGFFDKGTYFAFTINTENVQGEFYVMLGVNNTDKEEMFTWVNSSLLFDGGKCNAQFLNAFIDSTTAYLAKEATKRKCEITRNDIKEGLLVLANLKVKSPEYDSQAKTRLTAPDLRKDFVDMIDSQWKAFAKKNNDWLTAVIDRAEKRHKRKEDEDAIEGLKANRRKPVARLLDATGTVRSTCQLLIVEGDSAQGQISEARNPETTASFWLGGKINNVYDSSVAQVLKMEKLQDLLTVIGLTPGKKVSRSQLNYGKIIIATDADYDGDDIFTLLVNLFHQFWPELFDKQYEPIVYRLVAPNVVASKGKKREHFSRRSEYEGQKDKYKGWSIEYMKGLGSMWKEDWEMVLSGETDTLIPIIDDGKVKNTLSLLFSEDADARKVWLTADKK